VVRVHTLRSPNTLIINNSVDIAQADNVHWPKSLSGELGGLDHEGNTLRNRSNIGKIEIGRFFQLAS
jgi:hypothetical protein